MAITVQPGLDSPAQSGRSGSGSGARQVHNRPAFSHTGYERSDTLERKPDPGRTASS